MSDKSVLTIPVTKVPVLLGKNKFLEPNYVFTEILMKRQNYDFMTENLNKKFKTLRNESEKKDDNDMIDKIIEDEKIDNIEKFCDEVNKIKKREKRAKPTQTSFSVNEEYCKNGIISERTFSGLLTEKYGIKFDRSLDKMYFYTFTTPKGLKIKLVGIIDAFSSDGKTIFEFKSRQKHFLSFTPDQEEMQTILYLHIVKDAKKSILVQRFKNEIEIQKMYDIKETKNYFTNIIEYLGKYIDNKIFDY